MYRRLHIGYSTHLQNQQILLSGFTKERERERQNKHRIENSHAHYSKLTVQNAGRESMIHNHCMQYTPTFQLDSCWREY